MTSKKSVELHPARRIRSGDGDTAEFRVYREDRSWLFGDIEVSRIERVRYAGILCPETRKNPLANRLCNEFMHKWLEGHTNEGDLLIQLVCLGREKYGRLFARVQTPDQRHDMIDYLSRQDILRDNGVRFEDPVLHARAEGIEVE